MERPGEVHFPGTDKSKISTILGGYQEIGYKDKKKYGELYFGLGHMLVATYGNKPGTIRLMENGKVLTSKDSLPTSVKSSESITEKDGELYVEQKNPSLIHELILIAKWEPSSVKNLTLQFKRYMDQIMQEKVELNRSKQSIERKKMESIVGLPSYKIDYVNLNRLGAEYKFDKDSSWFSFDFYFSDAKNGINREYSLVSTIGTKLV